MGLKDPGGPFRKGTDRTHKTPQPSHQDKGKDDARPPNGPNEYRGYVSPGVLNIRHGQEDQDQEKDKQRDLKRGLDIFP